MKYQDRKRIAPAAALPSFFVLICVDLCHLWIAFLRFPQRLRLSSQISSFRFQTSNSLTLAALSLLSFAAQARAAEPPVTAAVFAREGGRVLVGSQAGVEVRSWPELKLERKLPVQISHIHDLAFSPDGKMLALAGGSPAEEGVYELLSWPEGKSLGRTAPHRDLIYAAAWSDDSRLLATASGDAMIRVVDVKDPAKPRTFAGHARGVLTLTFLPGGKKLVSAGIDQSLRVWDIETGREERSLVNHTAPVVGLAVRPTSGDTPPAAPAMVASISRDKTVRFWQPTIGRLVRFARLPSEPLALAWLADGSAIAIGCQDGRVRVIESDTLQVREDLAGSDGWIHTLTLSPQPRELFVGGERGQHARLLLQK